MSITYYVGDRLYIPDVDDIDGYLWKKYEDKELQNELLDTLISNTVLYGNHSKSLMKFRDELYLHLNPIKLPSKRYYYFKVNMNSIKIPSLKYRYKCIIDVHTFNVDEELDNIYICTPNIKTSVEKIYDCSFSDDYTLIFNADDNELFLMTDKKRSKYIRILESLSD